MKNVILLAAGQVFLVSKLTFKEEICKLNYCSVIVSVDQGASSHHLVGQSVQLRVCDELVMVGIVDSIKIKSQSTHSESLWLSIKSRMVFLNDEKSSKVYVKKQVREIIEESIFDVFRGQVFWHALKNPLVEYRVQGPDESTYQFLKRLCYDYGLYFWVSIRHFDEVLHISDKNKLPNQCVARSLKYKARDGDLYEVRKGVLTQEIKVRNIRLQLWDQIDLDFELFDPELTGCYRVLKVVHGFNYDCEEYSQKIHCVRVGESVPIKPAKRVFLPLCFESVIQGNTARANLDQQGRYLLEPESKRIPRILNHANTHLPLVGGTRVLVASLNNDIDQPAILSVLEHPLKVVTSQNSSQNRFETRSNLALSLDDREVIELQTKDQQEYLALKNSNQMICSRQGDLECMADRSIQINSDVFQEKADDRVQFESDQSRLSADRFNLFSSDLEASSDYLSLKGESCHVQSDSIHISSPEMSAWGVDGFFQGNAAYQVKNLTIQSSEAICIELGDAKLHLKPDELIIQANSLGLSAKENLNLNGCVVYQDDAQLVKRKVFFSGLEKQLLKEQKAFDLNVDEAPAITDKQPAKLTVYLKYLAKEPVTDVLTLYGHIDYEFLRSSLYKDLSAVFEEVDCDQMHLYANHPLEFYHKKTIYHRLPLSRIKNNCQREVALFYPPLVIDLIKQKVMCRELLMNCQKVTMQNNNTLTLFVHGFNVGPGKYGKYIDSVSSWTGLFPTISFSEQDVTVFRDLAMLRRQFPELRKFSDKNIQTQLGYRYLNGEGAHSWFVCMEHNIRKMREVGFNDYERVFGVIWDGAPGSPLDYMGAVSGIEYYGQCLAGVLDQLHECGFKLNVIAHSLGCGVLLHALNRVQSPVRRAVFWEPAIPADVFNHAQHPAKIWRVPDVKRGFDKLLVLHSKNDNVLGPIEDQMNGAKQYYINAQKPYMTELVPAVFLTYLGLGSLYSAAMTMAIPASLLVSGRDLESFYQAWIKLHPDAKDRDGKPLPKRFIQRVMDEEKYYKKVLKKPLWFHLAEHYKKNRTKMLAYLKKAPYSTFWGGFEKGAILEALETLSLHGFLEAGWQFRNFAHEWTSEISWMTELLVLVNTFFFESDVSYAPAMGYAGAECDDPKIQQFDQTEWLFHHSAMHQPSKDVMTHVYQGVLREFLE